MSKIKKPKGAPRSKPVTEEKKVKEVVGGMLADEEYDEELSDTAQRKLIERAEEDLLNSLADAEGWELEGVRLEGMSVAMTQLLEMGQSIFIVGQKGRTEIGIQEAMMEVAKFLYIMNGETPLGDRLKAVKDPDLLELEVLKFAQAVPLAKAESMMITIAKYVKEQSDTKVEPAESDTDKLDELLGNT